MAEQQWSDAQLIATLQRALSGVSVGAAAQGRLLALMQAIRDDCRRHLPAPQGQGVPGEVLMAIEDLLMDNASYKQHNLVIAWLDSQHQQ